ncbi:FAD-binding monooxygenase (plasmid) [Pseudonocardia sp. EC080610-09]|uniref:FAD-dependent monooxygenase n=1 Tax=Pseudonocardia sp. EC080610-09 TaxID=1688404 RepID=UPI000705B175|nr:FAD-dependent monooxygenase [Pseudonocardia sp. EC080610-09]ALL79932.1 FAD-binding monooxygenase [Pseudonocardia sp. EC080610-09]
MKTTDVLVVGGGPVGLALALDLAYRGVSFLLVEAGDGTVNHPRVGSVGIRSMELLRRWGVAEPVRNAGWPEDHPLDGAWVTSVGGPEIHRVKMGTVATRASSPHSPEQERICPQHWLMPILLRELDERAPDRVRLRHRLESTRSYADRVEATVTDLSTGATHTITARYLVAADGSSSSVRKDLGIAAPARHETSVFRNILFRAPELRERLGDRTALFWFLMSPPALRFPMRAIDGRALYRLTVGVAEGEPELSSSELVRTAVSIETPLEVLSDDRWHLTHRVANQLRAGRVLLLGDAAHTLSPSGGFGMNTGIAAAANLGWKLAAETAGWAGPGLLDSYDTECRPIAVRSLEEANLNLRRTLDRSLPPELGRDDVDGRTAREAMGERLRCSGVDREFRSVWVHLGARYLSPLVIDDGSSEPPPGADAWMPSAVPGCRAPHVELGDGVSTLDLFGTCYRLLLCDGGPADAVAGAEKLAAAFGGRGIPFGTSRTPGPEVAGWYGAPLVLVRPDGHVAWRGTDFPGDLDALTDTVRGGAR